MVKLMGRKKQTFENAMDSLESIVKELEAGDISLNELIDKYNEGIKLSSFCLSELNRAERAVNIEVKPDKDSKSVSEVKLNLEDEDK